MTLDTNNYKPGVLGDMYYRNAAGLLVPVAGAPGVGKVPVIQADGSVAWSVVAGGGGGGGATFAEWDPNKGPAAPNANDIEFVSGAAAWPAGWVDTTVPFDYTSFTEAPNSLIVRANSAGWKGKALAIPAGDFCIAAQGRIAGPGANFLLWSLGPKVGLTPFNSGTAAYSVDVGYHTGHGGWCVASEAEGGVPAAPDFGNSPRANASSIIQRWRRVGGNMFFAWSADGKTWYESAALAFAGATYMHLAYYCSTGFNSACLAMDWVRYIAGNGAAANFGALRVITGT